MLEPQAPSEEGPSATREEQAAQPAEPASAATSATPSPEAGARGPRPIVERIGLFGIAAVFTALFAGLAAAAWIGGEPVLTLLGAIGAFMTAWVGLITLVRG